MKVHIGLCILFFILTISCKPDPVIVSGSGSNTESATVSTLAGSTLGYAEGVGVDAKFAVPYGLKIDINGNGNIYIADSQNQKIRKVTLAGVVSTLAGSSEGYTNGTGSNAKFSYPEDVATDLAGNVYVADMENHSIRKITPIGVVTTLAGGTPGFADGTGANARFNFPEGLAVDGSGNVYVADTENYKIRKITPAGVVTTLAGSTEGYADGSGTNAQFTNPSGIVVDGNNIIYVADGYKVRKVTLTGVVTTVAGSSSGNLDGQGTEARFSNLYGITADSSGNLYVTDSGNSSIRKINIKGAVTTLAGGIRGYVDGSNTIAQFDVPHGITTDGGGTIYVTDEANNKIRKIVIN